MFKLSKLSWHMGLAMLSGIMGLGVASYATAEMTADETSKIQNGTVATGPMNVAGMTVAPSVMIVLGREHGLFSEAYDDTTDIDGNSTLDIMYDPSIRYEGIFDPDFCYVYQGGRENLINAPEEKNSETGLMHFGYWRPVSHAADKSGSLKIWDGQSKTVKICNAGEQWLGNFLNYMSTTRIDAIRKVLYGGARLVNNALPTSSSIPTRYVYTDSSGTERYATILKHSRVLRDSHAWGKVLSGKMYEEQFKVSDFTGLPDTRGEQAYFFALASYDGNGIQQSNYFRVGLVANAGMPGIESNGDTSKNYIWDWVSRQTMADTVGIAGPDYSGSGNLSTKINWVPFDDVGKHLRTLSGGQGVSWDERYSDYKKIRQADLNVVVCTTEFHSSDDCKNYGTRDNPSWQPVGLLQQYGEGASPRIRFGLITGSWANNLTGAGLRAEVDDFGKEINLSESDGSNKVLGDFVYNKVLCENSNLNCGFIKTIDRMAIAQKNDGNAGDGVYTDCPRDFAGERIAKMENGKCKDWGNPVSKLLYASAQYFKGTLNSKSRFLSDEKNTTTGLRIGHVTANDPYTTLGIEYCSKPVSLLIADENVSFDYDSRWGGASPFDSDTTTITDELKNKVSQGLKAGEYIVGKVGGVDESQDPYVYVPSLKHINNLADVEGIAPAAAFSHGSYNVAGVASYYASNSLRSDLKNPSTGVSVDPKMQTYVVAMKPNLPEINIDVNGKNVTIIPFAKTVGDGSGDDTNARKVISTNQVADFYIESLNNEEGVFRINYEDFQYGSDYDMDWVVEYRYRILKGSDGDYVRVTLRHVDGDKYAPQHAGYLITGVDHTGVYVDLAKTTAENSANNYYNVYELDTIVNDSSLINCPRGQQFTNRSFDKSTEGCRYPSGLLRPDDFRINGSSISSNNISDYYKNYVKPVEEVYYASRGTLRHDKDSRFSSTWNFTASLRLMGDYYRKTYLDGNSISSRVFKVSSSDSGNYWLKSPLWYAAKYGLGGKVDASDTTDPSNYFLVTNMSKLRDGVAKMLNQINKTGHSGSGFSTVTKNTTTGSTVYATTYDPSVWKGDVIAAKVGSDGGYNYESITSSSTKRASDGFASVEVDDRFIFTYDPNANEVYRLYSKDNSDTSAEGTAFKNLSCGIISDILKDGSCSSISSDDYSQNNAESYQYMNAFARWMAGDDTYEGLNTEENSAKRIPLNTSGGRGSQGTPLRERKDAAGEHFILGDIVNSDAVAFTDGNSSFVAVGANDGMLHILSASDMTPVISYLPSQVLPEIKKITLQDYGHYPYFDSTPNVYIGKNNNNQTKTYLYGTFGTGIKGGYLLDVTGISDVSSQTPEEKLSFARNMLKWELSEPRTLENGEHDGEKIGVPFAGSYKYAPTLVEVSTSSDSAETVPYLLFSSGIGAEKAGFFAVNMLYRGNDADEKCYVMKADGSFGDEADKSTLQEGRQPCVVTYADMSANEKLASDPWGTGRKADMTKIEAVSLNTNGFYQALYFGDTFGNFWKIDLNNNALESKVRCWGNETCASKTKAFNPNPSVIFNAVDANGRAQMITGTPGAGYFNGDGIGLIFGTGSYTYTYDSDDVSFKYNDTQTIYMLRDLGSASVSDMARSKQPVKRCDSSVTVNCLKPLVISKVANTDSEGNTTYTRTARVSSSYTATKNFGWYFDLVSFDTKGDEKRDTGERAYTDPLVVGNMLYMTTNTPNIGDACSGGGTSSAIEMDWVAGRLMKETTYKAIAKSPVLTIHDGKPVVNIPLDDTDQTRDGATPVATDVIPSTLPSTRTSSWIKLY